MHCSSENEEPEAGTAGDREPARPPVSTYRELPVVVVVGRPNAGKSTLFNRIVRSRVAIVDDQPGVTRDRNYRETHWAGKRFFLVDTGGLVPGSRDGIETLIRKQVEAAISEASLVVFVVDAADGITALDQEIAQIIRATGKNMLLAANKMDTKRARSQISEIYRLGLGDFIEISAEQGTSIGDLLDEVVARLPSAVADEDHLAAIAVVGKPNVGKSSLVNRLTGTESVIVDDEPGTTRDSIDTFLDTPHGRIRLVDTAGLRRKSKANTDLEKYANIRSVGAIDRSDVVVLMLDAASGVTKQDLTIASYVEKSGKGMVLVWNKWDLHEDKEKEAYLDIIKRRFRHVPYLPALFISCATGVGLDELMGKCLEIHTSRDTRIPTGVFNRSLMAAVERRSPGGKGKRFAKIYYAAQTGSKPPAFTLFVNDPQFFRDNYMRYLEKRIRGIYPFEGCPIRIRVRKSK